MKFKLGESEPEVLISLEIDGTGDVKVVASNGNERAIICWIKTEGTVLRSNHNSSMLRDLGFQVDGDRVKVY